MDTATPSSGDTDQLADHEIQHIKLACQNCQRKKIKCDRTFPCVKCLRSGLQCVPSSRKPRTRHAGKRAVDDELRARISKLEGLVESLSGDASQQADATYNSDQTSPPKDRQSSLDMGTPVAAKYVASNFWSVLTSEVLALKDVLEDEDASEEEPLMKAVGLGSSAMEMSPPARVDQTSPGMDYDLILYPPGTVHIMPGALQEPSSAMAVDLGRVFFENVDALYRIFHRPSLERLVSPGEPYLGLPANAPANKAILSAVWFAAVISLKDTECFQRYKIPKQELLAQYRRLVDMRLAQADLLSTTDVGTLQALVLYMITSRQIDTSRRVWTMLGLVVRIAQAMYLDQDNPKESPYRAQLHSRLWYTILLLDSYCAMDRGSEAILSSDSFTRSPPAAVNETDFDEDSTHVESRKGELTDMVYAKLAHEAALVASRFSMPDTGPTADTWQHRLDAAREFEKIAYERATRFCDPKIPWERTIILVAKSMVASITLRAIRPMQRHLSSVPPPVDSPYVLQVAVDSLKAAQDLWEDQELRKWQWMVWVQWHGLAVALAGLCSIRDTPLADDAWLTVNKAMDRYPTVIADARRGMLWRPIEKLYKTAVAFKDSGSQPSSGQQKPAQGDSSRVAALQYALHRTDPEALTSSWNVMDATPVDPAADLPGQRSYRSPMMTTDMNPHTFDFSTLSIDGTQLADMNGAITAAQPVFTPNAMVGSRMGQMDSSWLDWEKVMMDLDTVNMNFGDEAWLQKDVVDNFNNPIKYM